MIDVDLSGNLYYGRGYEVPAGSRSYDAPGGTKVATTAATACPISARSASIGASRSPIGRATSAMMRAISSRNWNPPHAEAGTLYPCPPPESPAADRRYV